MMFLSQCWYSLCIIVSSRVCASLAEAAVAPYLTVNGKSLSFSGEDKTLEFIAGQGANFTCLPATATNVSITFTTKDGETGTLASGAPASVYLKLRVSHDGARLACGAARAGPGAGAGGARAALTLRLDPERRGVLSFRVNGLILPRDEERSSPTGSVFSYRYRARERLAVQVVKDQRSYGTVKCHTHSKSSLELTANLDGNFSSVNVITLDFSNNSTETLVYCDVFKKLGRSWLRIVLSFSFEQRDYAPFIGGLSQSNVLERRRTSAGHFIRYYLGNDSVLLQCSTGTELAEFGFTSGAVVVSAGAERRSHEFRLRAGARRADVTCPAGARAPHSTTLTLVGPRRGTTADTTPSWLIAPGAAAAAVLAAAVACAAVRYNNKLKLTNKSVPAGYENAPVCYQSGDNTTSPSREDPPDNVVYCDPNSFDNMYAKPTPKAKRTKIEPTYAEPESAIRATNPDVTYAEICHTNNCDNFKAIEMPAYCEILPQITNYKK